jgi:hypothetical protein
MNMTIKYSTGILALAGLFFAGSIMQSKDSQAKGAFSSPVSVMNTTSTPVITELSSRVPYSSTANVTCPEFGSVCTFNLSNMPAGYRLIAQYISGYVPLADTSIVPMALIRVEGSNNFLSVPMSLSGANAVVNSNVLAFHTFSPQVQVSGLGVTYSSATPAQITIAGYLENCAVTGCPPVQH